MPTPVFLGFLSGSACKKNSARNVGDLGSILGLGRSPGEGKGYPLRYSGLENSMDCMVHGVTKSLTRLSNFQLSLFTFIETKHFVIIIVLGLLCVKIVYIRLGNMPVIFVCQNFQCKIAYIYIYIYI